MANAPLTRTPRTENRPAPKPAKRPEKPPVHLSSLISEAERIMGVKPILGRTKPRPGY